MAHKRRTHQEERRLALNWWRSLTYKGQIFHIMNWCEHKGCDFRWPQTLTGREIEEIFNH